MSPCASSATTVAGCCSASPAARRSRSRWTGTLSLSCARSWVVVWRQRRCCNVGVGCHRSTRSRCASIRSGPGRVAVIGRVRHARGILDTSMVIMLSRLDDPAVLPDEPLITAITLSELTVGPLVATTDHERAARQAHLQQAVTSPGSTGSRWSPFLCRSAESRQSRGHERGVMSSRWVKHADFLLGPLAGPLDARAISLIYLLSPHPPGRMP